MDVKVINPEALSELLVQQPDLCLVDVRTEAEMTKGFIKGATPLPLQQLPMRLQELDAARSTVFYCQIGARSAQAAAYASGHGFKEVFNLQGGMIAWVHAGKPVEV